MDFDSFTRHEYARKTSKYVFLFAILFQREERLLQRERELEQQYVAKVPNYCLFVILIQKYIIHLTKYFMATDITLGACCLIFFHTRYRSFSFMDYKILDLQHNII
jgi:hypothetical protein